MSNSRPFYRGHSPLRRGLTLVELLVVLVILIVVSVILVPLLGNLRIGPGNNGKTPQQIATEATMLQLRDAILGTPSRPGMWTDLGLRNSYFPQFMKDLLVVPTWLPANLQTYDPNLKLGWRGPYVQTSGALYGRTDSYGQPRDLAVLDGWGRPIVLQFTTTDPTDPNPAETRVTYARLVSAGANSVIDTQPSFGPDAEGGVTLTNTDCGDDVLLFFKVSVADTRQ